MSWMLNSTGFQSVVVVEATPLDWFFQSKGMRLPVPFDIGVLETLRVYMSAMYWRRRLFLDPGEERRRS